MLTLALLAFTPTAAEAHFLTMKKARVAVKRSLVSFDLGYKPGSGVIFCRRRSDHYVGCSFYFLDARSRAWCGTTTVRLRPGGWIATGGTEAGRCDAH